MTYTTLIFLQQNKIHTQNVYHVIFIYVNDKLNNKKNENFTLTFDLYDDVYIGHLFLEQQQ